MVDLADDLADPAAQSPPLRWMAAGAVAGGAVTLALVLLVSAALRPEPPPEALPAPRFVEEAAVAGVDHVYDGDFEFFVGGGVATFDCDDDGFPDMYLAGGSNPAILYRNTSAVGGPLAFERLDVDAATLTGVTGAYPLDVDSDGLVDLAVLRVGENVLLRGTGDCGFERANETWGFEGGEAWTAAFAATWEDDAAFPTLVFGTYLDLEASRAGNRVCADHELVRPQGAGFSSPQPLGPGYCTLSMMFVDWNGAGRQDLRVTNDRHYHGDGHEQLFRFDPGAAPEEYTEADGWLPMRIWGMGIAAQDLTGDGLPELYLTSQGDNKLQTLEPGSAGPTFTDIALASGVTAHRPFAGDDVLPSTAWHPEFADVNNDGLTDLFVAKGNVEAMPEFATDDPSNLLIGQADGTFVEGAAEAGVVDYNRGRGATLVDLNLDGLLDLVEVNRTTPVEVWRNVGAGSPDQPEGLGNWAAVRLRQPSPNRDAVGATIEVRTGSRSVVHQTTVGGGHASGDHGWLHLGLGTADEAEVRVTWPDGTDGDWVAVPAGTFSIIERNAPEATVWEPGSGGSQ